jgi:hypothetical protein
MQSKYFSIEHYRTSIQRVLLQFCSHKTLNLIPVYCCFVFQVTVFSDLNQSQ